MAAERDPLSTPTRIAFAGDWHMNPTWAVAAVRYAVEHGAEKIVHVGDFGYRFYPRFAQPLNHALEHAGIDLLFVDGNHDDHRALAGLPRWPNDLRDIAERIWYVPRGTRWEWNGVRFLGLGGAHSVDRPQRLRHGLAWWPEETITAEQADHAAAGGRADVMVTHDCPAGVDIPGLEESATWFSAAEIARSERHRELLRAVVTQVQPTHLFHGHYHRAYTADVDFGWPMHVVGLDMDGTEFSTNMKIVDLETLRPADRSSA